MADDIGAPVRASNDVIMLWPQGVPGGVPADQPPESSYPSPAANGPMTTMLRNVSDPSITVFPPDPAKANGVGVIVAPGGGWRILAWDHEGVDLANWLAERGYTAFLLKYRLVATPADLAKFTAEMAAMSGRLQSTIPAAKAPRSIGEVMRDAATPAMREKAADDGRRALEIIRSRATEWGVRPDRIGMIGFSAGAFLTADVALSPGGAPLAFAAPIYGGETRGAVVPANAPPLFTVIAQDDRLLFKVVEGLYRDWSDADRPAELHIFRRGGHGFGIRDAQGPVARWPALCADWLKEIGVLR